MNIVSYAVGESDFLESLWRVFRRFLRMISAGDWLGDEDDCFRQVMEYLRTHQPEPVEPGFKFLGEGILNTAGTLR